MSNRRVFLCCSGIDDVLLGRPNVAGIPVFLSMWARVFLENGYDVFSFSYNNPHVDHFGIQYVRVPSHTFLQKLHLLIFSEHHSYKKILNQINPDIVIIHGSSRIHCYLASQRKKLNFKLIYFGACDMDFVYGREFLNHKIDKLLYRIGLYNSDYCISQNFFQQTNLLRDYGIQSIILPTLWYANEHSSTVHDAVDFIWVSNIKPLKRLELFIKLAESLPEYKFVAIGAIQDSSYFEQIIQSNNLRNFNYWGPQPLNFVDDIISKSKFLVCTSEFEGFPNAFIQAWSHNIPVLSTVNPNNAITSNGLGCYSNSIDDIKEFAQSLLENSQSYNNLQENIQRYFNATHSPAVVFNRFIHFIDE